MIEGIGVYFLKIETNLQTKKILTGKIFVHQVDNKLPRSLRMLKKVIAS